MFIQRKSYFTSVIAKLGFALILICISFWLLSACTDDEKTIHTKESSRFTTVSPDSETTAAPTPASQVITFSINVECLSSDLKKIPNEEIRTRIPASGYLVEATDVAFSEGMTPLSLLLQFQSAELHVDVQESLLGSYVRSIADLPEKLLGGVSGWIYEINGKQMNQSADTYFLQPGDQVEWKYICGN